VAFGLAKLEMIMPSTPAAPTDLGLKDIITIVLGFITIVLSSGAFVISLVANRRASIERERGFRVALTDTLNKLMDLKLDFAKLEHEQAGNVDYMNKIRGLFGQRNGFLVDQADFLASSIPSLVTTYEFTTIATASAEIGNMLHAEQNYLKAIEIAPNDMQRAQASHGYAHFLYRQSRIDAGRQQFENALGFAKGEDNYRHMTRASIYQTWGMCEIQFNRAPEPAKRYFAKAREEVDAIDVSAMRETALANLDAAIQTASRAPRQVTPQAPVPPPPNLPQ
jgi:tetratricopeptide (TPR) repeat protein